MPVDNDNLVSDLNQLRRRQEKIAEDIDRLKEKYGSDELADLEKIEAGIYKTILDIDEIEKNRNAALQTEIEQNTVIFKARPR